MDGQITVTRPNSTTQYVKAGTDDDDAMCPVLSNSRGTAGQGQGWFFSPHYDLCLMQM